MFRLVYWNLSPHDTGGQSWLQQIILGLGLTLMLLPLGLYKLTLHRDFWQFEDVYIGTRESSEEGNQDYSWNKTFAIQGAS